MERPDVELRTWGRFRPFYKPGLNAVQVVEHLYGSSYPDVVIVHSTMSKHPESQDRRLLERLEDLRSRCTIVWRTFDPWDVEFYKAQYERYQPQIWLTWYPEYAGLFQSMFDKAKTRVYLFPLAVGRRFLSKWDDRPYDLALVGRCTNDGDSLSESDFNGLKVLRTRRPRRRTDAFAQLIEDLNRCRVSWNSPLRGKFATLRFVEAPACGTISLTPNHFRDLNAYYFPKDAYLTCNGNLESAIEMIRSMRHDREEYFRLQEKAYRIVMNNHQMRNRVMYLMDILNGKVDADPRDYYGIAI